MSRFKMGFSLIELIAVMVIMMTLAGLITLSLVNVQQKASLDSLGQEFISDIKQQQIKAMSGDSEGRINSDSYGVHLEQNSYVLFHGTSYLPFDPANFNISLPNNIQFISSGTDIIFGRISGEIGVPVSIQLQDTTNSNTQTIQLNKYGVVTSVN